MRTSIRHRSVALTAMLVLALALGAAACGGGGGNDGPQLSKAQYTKKANAACATLAKAGADLAKAQSPKATGEGVRKYVKLAAQSLRDMVTRLDDLNPPAALSDDNDKLGETLNSYADGLDSLADEVKDGETFRDALSANDKIVTDLNNIADRAGRTVVRLGLDGCQLAA